MGNTHSTPESQPQTDIKSLDKSDSDNDSLDSQILEAFDVQDFSKKEIKAMLKDAPPEELQEAARFLGHVPESTNRSQPKKLPSKHSRVELYIQNHAFITNPLAIHTASQRRGFTRNVYDYARAEGLSSSEANASVQKARLAYLKLRRLATIGSWIEHAAQDNRSPQDELARIREERGWDTDDLEGNLSDGVDSELGTEIDDSMNFLMSTKREISSAKVKPSKRKESETRTAKAIAKSHDKRFKRRLKRKSKGNTAQARNSSGVSQNPHVNGDTTDQKEPALVKTKEPVPALSDSQPPGSTRKLHRAKGHDHKGELKRQDASETRAKSGSSPRPRRASPVAKDKKGTYSDLPKGNGDALDQIVKPQSTVVGQTKKRKRKRSELSARETETNEEGKELSVVKPDGKHKHKSKRKRKEPNGELSSLEKHDQSLDPPDMTGNLDVALEGRPREPQGFRRLAGDEGVPSISRHGSTRDRKVSRDRHHQSRKPGDRKPNGSEISAVKHRESSLTDSNSIELLSQATSFEPIPLTLPSTPSSRSLESPSPDQLNTKSPLESTTSVEATTPSNPEQPTKRLRHKSAKRSPYFEPTENGQPKRRTSSAVSCIPFPPISASSFGLIQERLAHEPFKLLVAVTFLNRTRGSQAIPIFHKIMDRYPTPAALAIADQSELADSIRHLGLQNSRARRYIQLARAWIDAPPVKGRRHRKLNYPSPGVGKDIMPREVLTDDDERTGAWEIAHLPTTGPYAIDSWRIFCRDELRELATGWNGEGAAEEDFEPEWKRVQPLDKELRAYLKWMWLREGWDWDHITGAKTPAVPDQLQGAAEGDLVWGEDDNGLRPVAVENG